ncbi:MAG: hypothetical protein M9936_28820 [Caldilinea sp.]|nr:hypothetical protein [Caldilinea sp.]
MSAVAELQPLDRWLARVRQIGAHRPGRADYGAYERFKAELQREFQAISSDDYARAVMAIAAATGV